MHKEHSRVILTEPVESDDGGLMSPGDIGVVIHIHPEGEAYVLEFFGVDGETVAIASVEASQIRTVTPEDILHARVMKESPAKVG